MKSRAFKTQNKRKALGLCASCGKNKSPNYYNCSKCRILHNNASNLYYFKNKNKVLAQQREHYKKQCDEKRAFLEAQSLPDV